MKKENLTSESQLGGYTTCLGLRPVGGTHSQDYHPSERDDEVT